MKKLKSIFWPAKGWKNRWIDFYEMLIDKYPIVGLRMVLMKRIGMAEKL